jgi:hypothetical protein
MMRWLALLVAAALGVACGARESVPEIKGPAPLADGLESLSNESMVRARLARPGSEWTIVEEPSSRSGTGSNFRIKRLSIKPHLHDGVEGSLELIFFNDRLMATWFFPSQPEFYKTNLRSHEMTPIKGQITVSPNVRTWIARAADGRLYQGWEDVRLARERDQWLKENA